MGGRAVIGGRGPVIPMSNQANLADLNRAFSQPGQALGASQYLYDLGATAVPQSTYQPKLRHGQGIRFIGGQPGIGRKAPSAFGRIWRRK